MTFAELLDRFRGKRALVIGDLMLDEYHFGRATRISPEAPVMVIRHERTEHVPGGAANVALNLRALGAVPTLIGVSGCDQAGDELAASLSRSGLEIGAIIRDPSRPTTRKTRIVADHSHQVLRMDSESDGMLSPEKESEVQAAIEQFATVSDVIVLSDYLKGMLTPAIAQSAIAAARLAGVPAVANPKPRSLPQYRGASLISLNRAEAAEATGRFRGLPNEEALDAAESVRKSLEADAVLVTLGESGMAAAGPEQIHVPAPKVEVYDTAGAGDTVIATVALGLAAAGFRREVFELAAQTSACVVRHVGVATPSEKDLVDLPNR